jgi:hypothetical protein
MAGAGLEPEEGEKLPIRWKKQQSTAKQPAN